MFHEVSAAREPAAAQPNCWATTKLDSSKTDAPADPEGTPVACSPQILGRSQRPRTPRPLVAPDDGISSVGDRSGEAGEVAAILPPCQMSAASDLIVSSSTATRAMSLHTSTYGRSGRWQSFGSAMYLW